MGWLRDLKDYFFPEPGVRYHDTPNQWNTIPERNIRHAEEQLLKMCEPTILQHFGQKKPLDLKAGNVIRFRRHEVEKKYETVISEREIVVKVAVIKFTMLDGAEYHRTVKETPCFNSSEVFVNEDGEVVSDGLSIGWYDINDLIGNLIHCFKESGFLIIGDDVIQYDSVRTIKVTRGDTTETGRCVKRALIWRA